MMLEREAAADLFGLAGTFPRPGWAVLDAARDHRFTGELTFDVHPEVRVYFDRGQIYLAERSTDPSLGARLVDAGALNDAQLEHGSMRIGETDHLGRLFERVPSVDRDAVLLTNELMNEECVTWLARQQVRDVESVPYRHHPSGANRWERPADAFDLVPGDPLPAPPPTGRPVEVVPPDRSFDAFAGDADGLVQWDEPAWLDERSGEARVAAADLAVEPISPVEPARRAALLETDWVDRFETEGLPVRGRDPLVAPEPLPSLPVEPPDRFELIWPSGEVDEEFGATDASGYNDDPDHDRVGPTARIARLPEPEPEPSHEGLWGIEPVDPGFDHEDSPAPGSRSAIWAPIETDWAAHVTAAVEPPIEVPIDDDVVMSMRRAVASIETGSLQARRRLAENTQIDGSSRGVEPVVPGRVAARTDTAWRAASGTNVTPMRSVFDDETSSSEPVGPTEAVDAVAVAPVPELPVEESVDVVEPVEHVRVSALRRLIGGLRRR
jgi:hypothetical protein